MSKPAAGADLNKYIDKRLILKLNANRQVCGVLRGYDGFMNLTMDETTQMKDGKPVGDNMGTAIIRGNSIVMLESLEKVEATNYAPKTR